MRTLARFVSRTVLRLALLAALIVAAFVALIGVVDALPAPGDLWARAASAAAPSRPSGDSTPAVVTRVIDGDTITVSTDTDPALTVRLLGIDTPEVRKPDTPVQPCGPQASDRTRALATPGTAVRLEYDTTQDHTDRYGRTLAYVWIGGAMLNYTLVAEGWARTYVYNHRPGRHADALADAQRDAQAARAGVWGECPR
ncbi:thermonuclease family protein [Gordonia sp. (in: high G+C Gram-positive bacteria)]|uniref:thermonuclease family protein n=1 Tax=Gordonia sp. (in: high G+C Gram-positive bacteria) TaxID=84139 RepID=UPI00257B92CF|nr:thermonuclease family protein [Gordonia sp. (in: high G+C Gram-positive bacteria)]